MTTRLDAATLDAAIAALEVLEDEKFNKATALNYDNADPGRYDRNAHAEAVDEHAGVCHALIVIRQMRINL